MFAWAPHRLFWGAGLQIVNCERIQPILITTVLGTDLRSDTDPRPRAVTVLNNFTFLVIPLSSTIFSSYAIIALQLQSRRGGWMAPEAMFPTIFAAVTDCLLWHLLWLEQASPSLMTSHRAIVVVCIDLLRAHDSDVGILITCVVVPARRGAPTEQQHKW